VLIAFLYYFSVLVVLSTSPDASVSAWLVDSSERLLSCTQQANPLELQFTKDRVYYSLLNLDLFRLLATVQSSM